MEDSIKRAMLAFEREEKKTRWKKKAGRRKGVIAWNLGIKNYKKWDNIK